MVQQKPSVFHHLKKKWVKKHREIQKELVQKHHDSLEFLQDTPKALAAGTLAGSLMLANPVPSTLLAQATLPANPQPAETPEQLKTRLIAELSAVLPAQAESPLTPEQEQVVGQILTNHFRVSVSAELQGIRLNRSYGIIGAEQHLMRFPGDTMATHFDTSEEARLYYSSGMAPGRGAWGYFVQSSQAFTQKDKEREKYYIAVQTFLSPGWKNDVSGHYKFFRFRKMLVVNPENGKGMVAVIGDAGPAAWTGKHLGGSPEVMIYLERQDGRARGPVLYFFIDDPQDKIPLGPIEVQS